MADFSSFTDEEFTVLLDMFEGAMDDLHHYPDDVENAATLIALNTQFRADAKAKRLWWVKI